MALLPLNAKPDSQGAEPMSHRQLNHPERSILNIQHFLESRRIREALQDLRTLLS